MMFDCMPRFGFRVVRCIFPARTTSCSGRKRRLLLVPTTPVKPSVSFRRKLLLVETLSTTSVVLSYEEDAILHRRRCAFVVVPASIWPKAIQHFVFSTRADSDPDETIPRDTFAAQPMNRSHTVTASREERLTWFRRLSLADAWLHSCRACSIDKDLLPDQENLPWGSLGEKYRPYSLASVSPSQSRGKVTEMSSLVRPLLSRNRHLHGVLQEQSSPHGQRG